ncbi:hypothetical protein JCGZ_06291 [Jatropha curcas]|uniref:Uncharacterized protein n=1 Tax=Jatropha curcas TaxID=180498 RepID=A0A067KYC4_JATCU|nr:uncharacterized protein LOC105634993 [Jatropha curcas]KDP37235.1 hypothetical protein JCGZ_06291 [Jatropha curcas]
MEGAKEQESNGLLDRILPPRLEDAGLEECALPPDSIKEAFFKAASAVKSRATYIFTDDEEGDCVQDPWPEAKDLSDEVIAGSPTSAIPDALVGVDTEKEAPGSCMVEKGVVECGDKVVVGGGDVGEREKENGCLNDELTGLQIGDKKESNGGATGGNGYEEQKEKEGERPVLTEGFA